MRFAGTAVEHTWQGSRQVFDVRERIVRIEAKSFKRKVRIRRVRDASAFRRSSLLGIFVPGQTPASTELEGHYVNYFQTRPKEMKRQEKAREKATRRAEKNSPR